MGNDLINVNSYNSIRNIMEQSVLKENKAYYPKTSKQLPVIEENENHVRKEEVSNNSLNTRGTSDSIQRKTNSLLDTLSKLLCMKSL